ncbi:MAG: RibD family protein [Cyanobacteria bacterium P01_H01_bin.26]
MPRPHITTILAMSADGKITDARQGAARFPSAADKRHLEQCLSTADATLFGANTLRAYGTTALITNPALLERRRQQNRSPQPTHIVCSRSGQLDPTSRFFSQPVLRWLLTTPAGAAPWNGSRGFERVWTAPARDGGFDWAAIVSELKTSGFHHLVVMGGGQLVAALVAADLIDELWLTVCPLIIGGHRAPTPCDGEGFALESAPALRLLSCQTIDSEVFLKYGRQRFSD